MSAIDFGAVPLTYRGRACSGNQRTLAFKAFQWALVGDAERFIVTADALSDLDVDVFDVLWEPPGGQAMDVLVAAWGAQRYEFVQGVACSCLELGRRPGAVFPGYLPLLLERVGEGSTAQRVAAEVFERLLSHAVAQTGAAQMLLDRDGYTAGPKGQAILSRVCAKTMAQAERLAIAATTPMVRGNPDAGRTGRL